MSEETRWWEEEGSPEAESSPESESWWAARSRALKDMYAHFTRDDSREYEPGLREFCLLSFIVYVLWWAGMLMTEIF
jgi:hypothetical protein